MGFSLEKFGFPKKQAADVSAGEALTSDADTAETISDPQTEEALVDNSRRNFIIGAAAVVGSTFVGEEAEARNPERVTIERRIRQVDPGENMRNRPGLEPSRQVVPNRSEAAPRVEARGAMTYIGFSPTDHEKKILGIRLYRIVPDAMSIQISLHSDREFRTQNLKLSVLKNDGSVLSVIGKPVFTEPGVNKNIDLISRLLENLEEQVRLR